MRLFSRKGGRPIGDETHTDYTNLLLSMNKGQALFNQLKVLCHPDKYAGTEKEIIAEELFKLVQISSTDYEKLTELQTRIETDLL